MISHLFPHYREKRFGIFVSRQLSEMRRQGAEIAVIVPRVWCPRFLRRFERWKDYDHGCPLYRVEGLETDGIPGAVLFALFIIMLLLTVKRIPLGLEKLYARAVLTYLIITGLNINQTFQKHFWVFMTMVIVAERISYLMATQKQLPYQADEEEIIDSNY